MCSGWLRTMLSVSIVCLLALECTAASNAVAASSPRLALSRLRSSRGRHLQAVRHRRGRLAASAPAPAPAPPQGGKTKLTQAQELLKADEEATADFVRRCQVVVTVSDDKFLPVKPLERFCQTTDAAMECRLKVSQRLKDTHAREGDMGKFCSAVYDWFQGKYGMKCPKQCRKLQCKSTCMWLNAKSKLNVDNKELKSEMERAEKALKDLKALGKQVSAKTTEVSKQEFSIKMTKVKLGRAQKTLDETKKDHTAAKAKKEKVDKAAAKLEKTIATLADSLIKRDDSLMKQKFAIDKAKLTLKNMARNAARDMDKAKEDRAESDSLKKDAKKLGDALGELAKQTTDLKAGKAKDEKAAIAQKGVLAKKIAAVKKAGAELNQFKALLQGEEVDDDTQGDPWEEAYHGWFYGNYRKDPRVADLKELLKNQFDRAKAAEKLLDDINQKVLDATQQIKELDSDTARLKKQKGEADGLAAAALKKAVALEKGAKESIAKATTLKATKITKPTADYKKAQETQNKEKASKAKAEKTLKFMNGLQEEQTKKVDAVKGAVTSAQMAKDAQDKSLEEGKATLEKLKKEKADLEKTEKDNKATLAKNEKTMMASIKAYKAASKDLDKHKPEIVRLHSLQPE